MIRVFPRKTKWTPTDVLAFVGDPPFPQLLPPEQPVRVSCTFTWDRPEAERLGRAWRLYYTEVKVGGPAYDDPGGEFVPGRFVRHGITFTSRGCIRRCRFCLVPKREGRLRELPIQPGHNIADNNLLACSEAHIHNVFTMLRQQPEPIKFSGGLDARLLDGWHVELLRSIRLKFAWFACDSSADLPNLERAAALLDGFSREKLRCYVLIGWNGETIRQAEDRLHAVYRLGFLPFAMLYRDASGRETRWGERDWMKLRRTWTHPAAYKAAMIGLKRECVRWKP